jgi:AraC-like DNA-binding protein
MKVLFTKPQKQLSSYVASFWVFESSVGLPMTDSRIVVPDGRAKIIMSYSPLSVEIKGSPVHTGELQISLIGIQNNPRTICSPTNDTRTIGVELTPKGLYHFFHLSMYEITDQIYGFEDLFGAWGVKLQNRLGDIEHPSEKIAYLQKVLTHLQRGNTKDYSLLDYATDMITQSNGMLRIEELASQTGYSKRYLDMLFKEHVGLSPKSLANILRFQNVYQPWAQEKVQKFLNANLYSYYYDQAHFIKEFKRFTGYTPQKYSELAHEFGRAFYQQ